MEHVAAERYGSALRVVADRVRRAAAAAERLSPRRWIGVGLRPRRILPGSPGAVDAILAVAVTVAAVAAAIHKSGNGGGAITATPHDAPIFTPAPDYPGLTVRVLLGVILTAAPLAYRRRRPTLAFCVILAATMATNAEVTAVTFGSVIFAAYSSVVYSRSRFAALTCLIVGALVVTAAYPNTSPPVPERYSALLVLLPTAAVANAMRVWRQRAGHSAERLRRAEAAHEEQTRRAVEVERSRIASELHDVVTHNVSVMVVQAGAARRVLDESPDDAREAMLAVEASGRTAMAELRHLLGLLAPSGGVEGPSGVTAPQPGLAQLPALLSRVRVAGLPVELSVTGDDRQSLPPGLDLAVYRVVQEALTNVIKHAGQAKTVVRLDHRPDDLVVEVANDAAPAAASPSGAGRGLIGLRERIAIYGGELDAGPRPGGGWRVKARIPLAFVPLPAHWLAVQP
jgi:signal transduction histidine kinase